MAKKRNFKTWLVVAVIFLLFLIEASASAFSGSGTGTVDDPYQITNDTQLQEMQDNLNAHYVLVNDIDCSDTVNWNSGAGFEPIACWGSPCGDRPSGTNFRGSFDGQGHIITGLFINRPGENYVGLFGNVDHGTLKNVGLVDVDITGGDCVGPLTGGTHYVTVSNCYSTGNVSGDTYVGGLVCNAFHSTVSNCYSTANVNGNLSGAGGLAGAGCDGIFINSYSTGDVSGNQSVGGLVGSAYCEDGEIHDCYSTGNVSGDTYVGGLVGSNNGTITNCYYNNHAGNPSVGIGSGPGDCTAIGNNESYFYYSSNPPMDLWDFVDIWGIDEGVSYPYLLWQPPSIIYVDADATGGANNGSSWSDAYLYLKDALADANSNPDINEIRVADGTYKPDANTANPDGTGDREATFQLLNGVALYGGFPTGGGYWENRDTSAYPTILSGDLDGNDVQVSDPCDLVNEATRGENSYHVVTGSGTDHNAVLDGFTLTAGNANEPYPSTNGRGGGMYNDSGSPTVVNCTFRRNSAVDVGGGMSNYNNSGPTVTNCTFSGNWALDGGGMDNEHSGPTVTNCAFIGNSAEDGGGMCNANESTPTLTNCTFSGNSATYSGGGMWNMDGSDPNLTDCTFSGNSAINEGGGMDNDSSSPTVTNCTFTGNSAAHDGGGMNNENSSPMVSNCAFIGNSTEDGGGMCNYSSSPTVTNCTFTGNSAISPDIHVLGGGGMCNVEYSSPTLTNCILWGNSSPEPNGPQIALKDNSTVSISYCDLQGGQTAIYKVGTNNSVIWGEGNIDEAPLFIDANGLDGIGGTADDEEDYVHLRGYSPCINAGDPGGDYSGQVDIDNQPRVAYGRVDMGADEVFPIAGDVEPDGDVDFRDFAYFAEHWLLGN